ncbi:MAG: hypothetical protein WCD37_08555 [Chloroflexia bacterium]
MNQKRTGEEAAEAASDVLQDGRTADKSKSAAASALSQAGEGGQNKSTGEQAASDAADVLRDDSTGQKSKKAAGSALSQAED